GSPYYRGLSFSLPEFTQSLSPGAAYLTRSRGMLAHLLFCREANSPIFVNSQWGIAIHKHRVSSYLRAYKAADIYVPIIYVPIRHHLYNCKESSTNQLFYAKQTQFPKAPNEHKHIPNKYI
ncbi:MAG: hypothetical protein ACYTEO_16775, partial [Planctomycetota bacterium]